MKIFPELFKPAFVHCGLCPGDLINKIDPCDTNQDDHMLDLVSNLFEFISDHSEDGEFGGILFLFCVYNRVGNHFEISPHWSIKTSKC